MSVSTYAIIRKDVTLLEIIETLGAKYGKVVIDPTNKSDFYRLIFKVNDNSRMVSIFFNDYAKIDYNIDGILLSLGYWRNSKEIMMLLLEKFGGYFRENDCDDTEFLSINIIEFEKAREITPRDIFINKIITKVGYDKLNDVLSLFDEYKLIK